MLWSPYIQTEHGQLDDPVCGQISAILYDYLHEKIYDYHVLQADETPVLVNKDGRPAGSKGYMWVYRTGRMYTGRQIVLYEYQKTRNASHPREFLKNFSGICVSDGYQVYHTIENEREDLKIAGCWSHARRCFDEAVKVLPKAKQKDSRAYLALSIIQAIYWEEKQLKRLPAEERGNRRQLSVKPLVEAYSTWAKENISKVPQKSKTWEGFHYSLNQKKYLKVFLEDGEVPMDNNAAERRAKSYVTGRKNFLFHDTEDGATASTVAFSLVETAKANNLNIYQYLYTLLLYMSDYKEEPAVINRLMPWSDFIKERCSGVTDTEKVTPENRWNLPV